MLSQAGCVYTGIRLELVSPTVGKTNLTILSGVELAQTVFLMALTGDILRSSLFWAVMVVSGLRAWIDHEMPDWV